jgi:hypothetical protein
MFLGTAGYVTGHALKEWGASPEIGVVLGTLGAGALSVITGLVAIRRQGIYFAMITLALSQLLFFTCRPRSPTARTASRASRRARCSASSTCRSRSRSIMSYWRFPYIPRAVSDPTSLILESLSDRCRHDRGFA